MLIDIENMITETFVTELNENASTYDLISFSGETKTGNKLHLTTPHNKLKFNLKKDIYKNKAGFELGKVHTKMLFSTRRDNVLNFGILCTRKNKTVGKKIKNNDNGNNQNHSRVRASEFCQLQTNETD